MRILVNPAQFSPESLHFGLKIRNHIILCKDSRRQPYVAFSDTLKRPQSLLYVVKHLQVRPKESDPLGFAYCVLEADPSSLGPVGRGFLLTLEARQFLLRPAQLRAKKQMLGIHSSQEVWHSIFDRLWDELVSLAVEEAILTGDLILLLNTEKQSVTDCGTE